MSAHGERVVLSCRASFVGLRKIVGTMANEKHQSFGTCHGSRCPTECSGLEIMSISRRQWKRSRRRQGEACSMRTFHPSQPTAGCIEGKRRRIGSNHKRKRQRSSLTWGLSVLVLLSSIGPSFARKTHFLTGNLSSIVIPSEKSDEYQAIASNGKARQALIKSEVAKAIKAILREKFPLTGHETILPTLDDVETDALGRWHIRYKQYVDGLPVEGASVVVHVDPQSGSVFAINGEFHPDSPFEAKEQSVPLECETAVTRALEEYGVSHGEWLSDCTETVVQGRDGKAHRTFKRLLGYQPYGVGDPYQLDFIFANRGSGALVAVHPQVFGARSINTFDCRRKTGRPDDCKLLFDSPDPVSSKNRPADDAHNHAIDAYDFYLTYFGRDSFDDNGGTIRSFVNYGSYYNNAFYSSVFGGVVYGNGDRVQYNFFSKAFDVVAHEFTHLITFATSKLVYMGESGALNEAVSDIFGSTAERLVQRKSKSKVWLIGEDLLKVPYQGLRSMDNPPAYSDPDNYADRYQGAEDNYGVHINSGIINKAFFLMVEGGVHPVTQISVPALQPDFDASILEAAQIFYDANTKCLSENSDFSSARQCTLMFATTPGQVESVTKAWDAVGVGLETTASSCVPKRSQCSVSSDCCGKKVVCDGPDGNQTCKRCKRVNQPCARGSSCCQGLKCRRNVCVAKRK